MNAIEHFLRMRQHRKRERRRLNGDSFHVVAAEERVGNWEQTTSSLGNTARGTAARIYSTLLSPLAILREVSITDYVRMECEYLFHEYIIIRLIRFVFGFPLAAGRLSNGLKFVL